MGRCAENSRLKLKPRQNRKSITCIFGTQSLFNDKRGSRQGIQCNCGFIFQSLTFSSEPRKAKIFCLKSLKTPFLRDPKQSNSELSEIPRWQAIMNDEAEIYGPRVANGSTAKRLLSPTFIYKFWSADILLKNSDNQLAWSNRVGLQMNHARIKFYT